jgi:hypothetical protein
MAIMIEVYYVIVAFYVHGHHSVRVTDAWRVLQAICHGRDKLSCGVARARSLVGHKYGK